MIYFFLFNSDGLSIPIFVSDSVSGYTGIDVLKKPAVYAEVTRDLMRLQLAELQGSIDGYTTKLMPLVLDISAEQADKLQLTDLTMRMKQLVSLPDTAANMVISKMDEDERDVCSAALEVLHFYETVTRETKVFLPEESFQLLGEEASKEMRSVRRIYALQSSDNKEILQKDCNSKYGVVLPSVEAIHSKADVTLSSLDLLRVAAPYRREVSQGAFQYNGIYHTPYYRVDPKIRGMVPSYLKFINGYPKNNNLAIQPFEHNMYDNLYMFIMEDVSCYISEIVTALFFLTQFGQQLRLLFKCRNEELLQQLVSDIMAKRPDGVEFNITYSEIKELYTETFEMSALSQLVKSKLKVSDSYILDVLLPETTRTHVVDIDQIPFVLDLSDEMKEKATEAAGNGSCITLSMLEFCVDLCSKAYELNWGHTGATKAIPHFVTAQGIQLMDKTVSAYISQVIGQIPAPGDTNFRLLYKDIDSSFDDDEADDEADDEILASFNYYITNETAQRIAMGTLPSDYFTAGSFTGAESKDSCIVEYIRKVNGSQILSSFITTAFLITGSIQILLEAFYKLMRWGDNKPTLLVFDAFPQLRTVFDLNTGEEILNTAVVDESKLVLSNGCKYHFEQLITAPDVVSGTEAIVGLLLSKNYGDIKKYTMCSWVDVGEAVSKQDIDIDILKMITKVPLTGDGLVSIVDLESKGYALFASSANIAKGLEYNVVPAEFSELALLQQPSVLRSAEYLKSKQNKVLLTTRDRQYDILSRYCNAIRQAFSEESSMLQGDSCSTSDLSALAVRIYELFNATTEKADANNVRSATAIKQMNIDLGEVAWDVSELEGKFAIVSDMDMQSTLPAIEFSNEQVKKLAMKLRDRVVMLMLETENAVLLCRKDVQPSEISIVNHNVEHRKYTAIEPAIKAIMAGKNANITNKSGDKKPIKIHKSLGELLK